MVVSNAVSLASGAREASCVRNWVDCLPALCVLRIAACGFCSMIVGLGVSCLRASRPGVVGLGRSLVPSLVDPVLCIVACRPCLLFA